MPVIQCEASDSRLDPFRDLQSFRSDRFFVAEGERTVRRLLHSQRYQTSSLVGNPSMLARLQSEFPDRFQTLDAFELSTEELRQLTGFDFHRGCLALGQRPEQKPLQISDTRALAIVGLADPANIGAILRNARAFGVEQVLLDEKSGDPLSRRAIRSSAGQVFELTVYRSKQLLQELQALKRQATHSIVAAETGAQAIPISSWSPQRSTILLLGHEGDGLPQGYLELADTIVEIPLADGVDSLNVAAASAVFLHHWRSMFN